MAICCATSLRPPLRKYSVRPVARNELQTLSAPTVKQHLAAIRRWHSHKDRQPYVTALGRYSDVATVSSGDGRKELPLPALYDCRLSHM